MGRRYNEKQSGIKREQVVSLLKCGLTGQQICNFFGVSQFTLNGFCKREFGKTFEQVKAEHSVFLQATIMSNLVNMSKHNASAAIFLAKSVCGMSDQPAPPVDSDASESFTNALKIASRSIGNLEDLANVPLKDEPDATE